MSDILLSVSITNFRNISSTKKYVFENGITLLKGCSSAGKTTIFSAIEWCLYGKAKNVIPLGSKNVKTNVILETYGMIINRKKNKDVLTLMYPEESIQLIDDEAQSFINKIFGPRKKFFVLSYIEQKKYTYFFDMKDSERLDFLNVLSLDGKEKQIDEFKAKIDMQVKTLESEIKEIDILLNYEIKKLHEYDHRIDYLDDVTEDMIDYDKLRAMKTHYQELVNQKNEYNKCIAKVNILLEQIKRKQEFLETINVLPESEFKNFKLQLQISQELKKKITLKNDISNAINTHEAKLKIILDRYDIDKDSLLEQDRFTVDQIRRTVNNELKFKEFKNICSKMSISYEQLTEENLSNMKSDIRSQIDKLHQRNKYIAHITNLQNKEIELNKIPDIDYDEEIRKIQKAIDIGHRYSCPSCQKNLYIKNGRLELADEQIPEIVDKKRLSQLQDQKKKRSDLMIQISSLKSCTDVMFSDSLEISGNVKDLEQKLEMLCKLEILEESDITSTMMTDFNEMKKLYSDILSYEDAIKTLDIQNEPNMEDLNHDIQFFKDQIKINEINQVKYKQAVNDLANYEKDFNMICVPDIDLSSLESEIDTLEQEIESYEKKLKLIEVSLEVQKLRTSIKDHETQISNNNDHVISLTSLRKNTTLLECMYLESKIKSINLCFNEFLQKLDVKYSIYLKLLKGNKNVKTGVFLNIIHNGVTFSDLSIFCGGEMDRVSFALSLCFNHLFNGFFVIFDEVFSSLDSELKCRCIDLLKSINSNAIIISHEEVEGYYDGRVITVS